MAGIAYPGQMHERKVRSFLAAWYSLQSKCRCGSGNMVLVIQRLGLNDSVLSWIKVKYKHVQAGIRGVDQCGTSVVSRATVKTSIICRRG